jgi:phytoene synthase
MITRDLDIRQRTWSAQEAFRHCERITSSHYENFPVASLFLPRDKRKYVCAIYAFARTADDFADESGLTPAERIESLNTWEEMLLECAEGTAHDPVFVALAETMDRFQIPVDLFRRLLQAFRQDVTVHRYETFEDLLRYCENSANPVGRLILLLFNYRSEQMAQLSDHICTALQLTNFWQDVRVDLDKDRIYIPLKDMRDFGYSEPDLLRRRFTDEFRRLLAFEIHRTRALYLKGRPLLSSVGKDLAFELRMTWSGGTRILEKLEGLNYDVFRHRPTLKLSDKINVLLRALSPV